MFAKYLNGYTAIAPAGATSSDTALPVVIKYTNEEVTMMSVINGIICTALIPVLINTLYAIFS